jgi:hypothetical protein
VQVLLVSHSEHNYFGDSDLEILGDELQELEESKSEYKSDVGCSLLYGNA